MVLLLLAGWLGLAAPTSPAAAGGSSTLEVAALGFDGRVRLGAWTPVWVDVVPGTDVDGAVVIDAPTPSGDPVVRYHAPIRAAAGARVRVFIPAIFFDARQPGTVALEVSGRRVATRPLPRVRPADEIVVILSGEPVGAEVAIAGIGRLDASYVSEEFLPQAWQAYEAVRLLAVRDLDERRIDDRQRAAVHAWIWAGGRVLLMPAGDDRAHLTGPTFGPVRQGASGRGHVITWTDDPAGRVARGDPVAGREWNEVLAVAPSTPAPGLEAALPAGRPVPLRTHLAAGLLVLAYVVAVRWASRSLATLRAIWVATAVALVVLATIGAAQLSILARRDASGVVTAIVFEVLPGTGHGLLRIHGRVVSSQGGAFAVSAPAGVLMRPQPPSPVTIMTNAAARLEGRGTGLQVLGAAVVPAVVTGTFDPAGDGVITIANRSGRPIDSPWIFAAGRVQPVAAVGETAHLTLDESRWQTHDRLQRTEPNHALLMWAFSRLEADAILRATPAWLVGWWRDPALALAWDGRPESPLQLVLVPLSAAR